eukprot:11030411-Alexandrium_andersonii.AAC.1
MRDGFFWGVLWEVKVNHAAFRAPGFKHRDQWMVQEEGIFMEALWVTALPWDQIPYNTYVARCWDPWLEAHPSRRNQLPVAAGYFSRPSAQA